MRKLVIDSENRRSENDNWITVPETTLGYSPDKVDMIANLLQQAKDQATKYLHREINITTVGYPNHLDAIAGAHICDTVYNANATSLVFDWHVHKFLDAVRRAYGLNTCLALGHPEDCDSTDSNNWILFIDLGIEGLLNLWAGDVTEYGVFVGDREERHEKYCLDEDSRSATEIQSSLDKLPQILDGFIKSHLPLDCNGDLRAIILSGESSPNEILVVKQALLLVISETWKPLIRDEFDPMFVAAMGTARRAQLQIDDSSFHRDIQGYYMEDPQDHDEL
ncbi:hypothetical protein BO71DRAFT_429621 [Aspergillus ellipticus CBS 707.79]|uniref:Uncharacterized protein n=1 Tax=Aspergillus ellipticus CBS 707.79 TaxID=1448320 RepID=A0A319DBS1_9EURO|nr:hypothetical protein BO71DRAFT_429621 [Aspergillus ellipticus CBS 707.79]